MEIDFEFIKRAPLPDIKRYLKALISQVHGNDRSNIHQACRDLINSSKEFNLVFNEERQAQTIIHDYQVSIQTFFNDMAQRHYEETGHRINPQTEGFAVPSQVLHTFVMCSSVFQFFRDLRNDNNLYTDFLECLVMIDDRLVYFDHNGCMGIYDDCWLHAIKAILYGCGDYDYFYSKMKWYLEELYNTNVKYHQFVDSLEISVDDLTHALQVFVISREINDLYVDMTHGSHTYDDGLVHDNQLSVWNVDKFGETFPSTLVPS